MPSLFSPLLFSSHSYHLSTQAFNLNMSSSASQSSNNLDNLPRELFDAITRDLTEGSVIDGKLSAVAACG